MLVSRIDAYLARTGMSEREFGISVTGDHKWLQRLRAGRVSLQSIEKAESLLEDSVLAMRLPATPAPCEVG